MKRIIVTIGSALLAVAMVSVMALAAPAQEGSYSAAPAKTSSQYKSTKSQVRKSAHKKSMKSAKKEVKPAEGAAAPAAK